MAGKGGKGLIAAKIAAGMDKEKKPPITRSARAGLQVAPVLRSLVLVPLVALLRHLFLFRSSLCFVPCARSWA
jgi:hypothetical protein